MNWKEFFKPTIGKIVLFVVLGVGINLLFWVQVFDARILNGVPLGFWPTGSFMMWSGAPTPPTVEFSWVNFIIDIIFWYLIACGIVALFTKIRKK